MFIKKKKNTHTQQKVNFPFRAETPLLGIPETEKGRFSEVFPEAFPKAFPVLSPIKKSVTLPIVYHPQRAG